MAVAGVEGPAYQARGIIYLNAEAVISTGIGGKAKRIFANLPGEPFLDDGLDLDGEGRGGRGEENQGREKGSAQAGHGRALTMSAWAGARP